MYLLAKAFWVWVLGCVDELWLTCFIGQAPEGGIRYAWSYSFWTSNGYISGAHISILLHYTWCVMRNNRETVFLSGCFSWQFLLPPARRSF